jgi:hypothetical protein
MKRKTMTTFNYTNKQLNQMIDQSIANDTFESLIDHLINKKHEMIKYDNNQINDETNYSHNQNVI